MVESMTGHDKITREILGSHAVLPLFEPHDSVTFATNVTVKGTVHGAHSLCLCFLSPAACPSDRTWVCIP